MERHAKVQVAHGFILCDGNPRARPTVICALCQETLRRPDDADIRAGVAELGVFCVEERKLAHIGDAGEQHAYSVLIGVRSELIAVLIHVDSHKLVRGDMNQAVAVSEWGFRH